MGRYEVKYTPEQREAAGAAYGEQGIRPASEVRRRAKAGELTYQGEPLEPFDMPETTIRGEALRLAKRRAGKATSALAAAPPRDAIEALRRRLVNAADALLGDIEKKIRRDPDKVDPERLRQMVRVVREAAAIPGPDEQRPPKPGARQPDGAKNGATTRGGVAGAILADLDNETPEPTPATDAPQRSSDNGHAQDAQNDETTATPNPITNRLNAEQDDTPGSSLRELGARLGLDGADT